MSDNDREKNKPLSIDEAINKLKAEAPKIEETVKKEMSKAPITTASPDTRRNFLNYAISLLEVIDDDLRRRMPFTAGKEDMARVIRAFMYLRVNGVSERQIAKRFGVERTVVMKLDKIALEAVKRIIDRKIKVGVPIVGGGYR